MEDTTYSNSDDDILGINDDVVDLPTPNVNNMGGWEIHKRRSRKLGKHNQFNKSANINWRNPNVSPILEKRRKSYADVTKTIPEDNARSSQCHWLQSRSDDIVSYSPDAESFKKYQRLREVRNVKGFIVNIHDATNFDIDLELPPNLHEKYSTVISNQYIYKELGDNWARLSNVSELNSVNPEIGTTYRCRLKGIGISQMSSPAHIWKSNKMCIEIKQLIDRADGWVTCTLSDIDIYQRLLVDITINVSESINLKQYILTIMESEADPVFYPYCSIRR